jgi:hypothetical protein
MDMEIVIPRGAEYPRSPAVGRCRCGGDVVLDGFTCPCNDCGRDYNGFGQELAPRHQWDQDVETLDDLLRYDSGYHVIDPNQIDPNQKRVR